MNERAFSSTGFASASPPLHPWLQPSARSGAEEKTHGFTLVELLVVISIVVLLVALLLPALSRSRAVAQRVLCGGNERQLYQCVVMYANDFNRFCPTFSLIPWVMDGSGLTPDGYVPSAYGWMVRNYSSSSRLQMCPSQIKRLFDETPVTNGAGGFGWTYIYPSLNGPSAVGYSSYAYFPSLDATWENAAWVGAPNIRSNWRLDETAPFMRFGGPTLLGIQSNVSFLNMAVFTDMISMIQYDHDGSAGSSKTCHLETSKPAGGNVALGDGSVAWQGFDANHWCSPPVDAGGGYGAIWYARQWSFNIPSSPISDYLAE